MAAETLTETRTYKKIFDGQDEHELEIIKCACVCDTGDGTFSLAMSNPINGRIVQFITDPGSPAPTNLYDMVLTHPTHGYDIMGGAGADLLTATTELKYPEDGAANPFPNGVWVEGVTPTITLTNQSENGAKFDLYIYVRKG
jgi:hypothetical protein